MEKQANGGKGHRLSIRLDDHTQASLIQLQASLGQQGGISRLVRYLIASGAERMLKKPRDRRYADFIQGVDSGLPEDEQETRPPPVLGPPIPQGASSVRAWLPAAPLPVRPAWELDVSLSTPAPVAVPTVPVLALPPLPVLTLPMPPPPASAAVPELDADGLPMPPVYDPATFLVQAAEQPAMEDDDQGWT